MNLSKSRYASYCQCPKKLWLDVFNPEASGDDAFAKAQMASGVKVGEFARSIYGPYEDATVLDNDGHVDLNAMLERTRILREAGTINIAEASFSYDGCYCAVDILRLVGNNIYEINEVKSCTVDPDSEKSVNEVVQKYLNDISYQKWVLCKLGINVAEVNLVCMDSRYSVPADGHIDPQSLFTVIHCGDRITQEMMNLVETRAYEAKMVLETPEEIEQELNLQCKKPFDCPFIKYCMAQAGIQYPSVFNLYRAQWRKKIEYMNKGIMTFEDVRPFVNSTIQKLQIKCITENSTHIDKHGLLEFINSLSYPLYFLDFETMNEALPEYPGTKAYQQVPFQYSLHIKQDPDAATLEHREFLGQPEEDPRRALAEQLCADIPMNVCVVAYNKQFECGRIRELAEMYPDLADHLMAIERNIVDLLIPFQNGYYYTPEMKDSFSIKSVLPALFPDSEELNYHNLNESVQNGTMAMNAYPAMRTMNESQRYEIRQALLAYCCLDTLAMVRVLEKVYEAIDNN